MNRTSTLPKYIFDMAVNETPGSGWTITLSILKDGFDDKENFTSVCVDKRAKKNIEAIL